MTHEYTLLVGGTILPGPEQPPAEAIAWAEGIVLALGTDAQVRGVSRGDSHVFQLHGAFAVPLGTGETPIWPPAVTLEVGGPADLAILAGDPRVDDGARRLALVVVRGGHAVRGSWPPTD